MRLRAGPERELARIRLTIVVESLVPRALATGGAMEALERSMLPHEWDALRKSARQKGITLRNRVGRVLLRAGRWSMVEIPEQASVGRI